MRKRQRKDPEISTASLPDIIFMLLFFFMVVTVLRKDQSKLIFEMPFTLNNTKIEQSKHAAYLYVGKTKGKDAYSIQVNDRFVSLDDLERMFLKLLSDPEVDISSYEITLKADRKAPMYLVRALKLSMRKAGIKHLYYLSQKSL